MQRIQHKCMDIDKGIYMGIDIVVHGCQTQRTRCQAQRIEKRYTGMNKEYMVGVPDGVVGESRPC